MFKNLFLTVSIVALLLVGFGLVSIGIASFFPKVALRRSFLNINVSDSVIYLIKGDTTFTFRRTNEFFTKDK